MFDQHCRLNNDCCCSSSSSSSCLSPTRRINSDINNISVKRTIYVLDNELRLRPILNNSNTNSSTSTNYQNTIGRFDELTHFFNIINGIFHQPTFTFGLSTYHLARLFHLSNLNLGIIFNFDQYKLDLLQNMTIYSIIGRQIENSTINNDDSRQSKSMGIIKFQTSNQNLIFGINHRWSSYLSTMFRFEKQSSKKFWSHIEYRRPKETYEFIGEYSNEHLSNFQFHCLSCLWKRNNYQIDGGFNLRISQKENFLDLGFRLRYFSNIILFKCDFYQPFKHYLIAFQRSISKNFLIGLLIEKFEILSSSQSIKFSLMSQWNLNEKLGLRINTLLNTQNQFGFALIHHSTYFPFVFQIFNLYSWTTHQCKYGLGIQYLL